MKRREFFRMFAAAPAAVAVAVVAKETQGMEITPITTKTGPDMMFCDKEFEEMVTLTFRNRSDLLAENITQHNALLSHLTERKHG